MVRKRLAGALLIAAFCTMVLTGCGNGQKDVPVSDPASPPAEQISSAVDTTGSDTSTVAPESIPANDTAQETAPAEAPKEELQWDTETLKNDTGKTLIRCIGNQRDANFHVSFGIVSTKGTTILADPIYSTKDRGYIKTDILTVSHSHSDHYNQKLQNKMKDYARLSYFKAEDFTVEDVNVIGVNASHSSDPINESRPSNVINVYEVDGIRIAHMGDMGQDELTADQLEKLGQVDIVMTIITNAPAFGSATEKNIRVLQQLNPKIVMPTHYNEDVIAETMSALGVKECERASELVLSKEDLKDMPMRFIIVE